MEIPLSYKDEDEDDGDDAVDGIIGNPLHSFSPVSCMWDIKKRGNGKDEGEKRKKKESDSDFYPINEINFDCSSSIQRVFSEVNQMKM